MQIIIIGCGKVGRTLAEQLQEEESDITLVDVSSTVINSLQDDIDAMGIVGNGASINTLMEAGIENADILIAVTGSDEMNLLCCLIAQKTGHCQTIARVRNPIYGKEIAFIKERLGVTMIINPELAAAQEISRLLRFPSAIKIDTFAKGHVELLKFKVLPEFDLDRMTISRITETLRCDVLFCAVESRDAVSIPGGNYVIHSGISHECCRLFQKDRAENQPGKKCYHRRWRNYFLLPDQSPAGYEYLCKNHRTECSTLRNPQ